MKLIVLILTTAILQVSANTYAQKVTLSEKNAPLTKIFNQISQQSGYDFLVTKSVLDNAKPVTIKVTNAELKDVLNQIFQNQPLEYEITDKSVLVREKAPTVSDKPKVPLNTPITISGKVVDETGQPMAGVTVKEKGTANGVVTDAKGMFSLTVSDDKAMMFFSFVGFETQELKVKDIGSGAVITLKTTSMNLKEVVVNKGYYSTKEKFNTGSVSIITSKEIGDQPVSNPLLALEGRIPGMQVVQNSGVPGTMVTVSIRGQNSIGNGNEPLYVIDGVPFNGHTLFDEVHLVAPAGIASSPFNNIIPSDIERIEILKDADATSIYGSRGANGVVLITTKRGRVGEQNINITSNIGIGKNNGMLKLLNTNDYLKMRHQAFKNDGVSKNDIPDDAYDINGVWDTTRYTDWQKMLVGGTAKYSDFQGSISGSNINSQYLINSTYHKETTVFPSNFSDRRGSVLLSLNNFSSDRRFQTSATVTYSTDINNLPLADLSSYIYLPPDAPSAFDSNGSLNWENSTWDNPMSLLLKRSKATTDNLLGNFNILYNILPGLDIKSDFGYTYTSLNQILQYPKSSYNPAIAFFKASSTFIQSQNKTWNIEPQISYKKTLGPNVFSMLLGGTFLQQSQDSMTQTGTGYETDFLLEDIQAAPSVKINSVSSSIYRYNAFFGRLGYILKEKYILNITGRRDGSSRFGINRRFSNFGSFGAAWIFSDEQFFKKSLKFISYGKLHSSFGTNGNDQIGDYKYLETYGPSNTTYQGISLLHPLQLLNSNYSWERSKKFEIGLDLGLFENRLSLSSTYFKNVSNNQLINYPLPNVTGFTSIIENLNAVVVNQGFEFELIGTPIKTSNFSWNTTINLTIPRNRLVSFPNLQNSSYSNFYVIGQSLSTSKRLRLTNVDPATGVYSFYDYDKNGTISVPNDLMFPTNTAQQYYGGVLNQIKYHNWSLSFFFQFVGQKNGQTTLSADMPGTMSNLPYYLLNNTWMKPGDIKDFQKLSNYDDQTATAYYNNYLNSSGFFRNASFIRLKNLAFSYNVPTAALSRLHIRDIKLFIQGQNLFTITGYPGNDPESKGLLSPIRTLTCGFQLTF